MYVYDNMAVDFLLLNSENITHLLSDIGTLDR